MDGIVHGTVITTAGQALGSNVPNDEADGALKPLPERLEAVGRFPDVTLTLLLVKLVGDTFRSSNSFGCCHEAAVLHVYMSTQASDLKDSAVAKLPNDRHAEWKADLPLPGATWHPSNRPAGCLCSRIASASGSTRSINR